MHRLRSSVERAACASAVLTGRFYSYIVLATVSNKCGGQARKCVRLCSEGMSGHGTGLIDGVSMAANVSSVYEVNFAITKLSMKHGAFEFKTRRDGFN